MRWSFGGKAGENGGDKDCSWEGVCVWEGERCKMKDCREVWVPASGWGLSGSAVLARGNGAGAACACGGFLRGSRLG